MLKWKELSTRRTKQHLLTLLAMIIIWLCSDAAEWGLKGPWTNLKRITANYEADLLSR